MESLQEIGEVSATLFVRMLTNTRKHSFCRMQIISFFSYSSVLPSNFFRPVIGTFSAEGIGHDTVDTSYKDRGFGLSRHQVIQDRKFSEKNKP